MKWKPTTKKIIGKKVKFEIQESCLHDICPDLCNECYSCNIQGSLKSLEWWEFFHLCHWNLDDTHNTLLASIKCFKNKWCKENGQLWIFFLLILCVRSKECSPVLGSILLAYVRGRWNKSFKKQRGCTILKSGIMVQKLVSLSLDGQVALNGINKVWFTTKKPAKLG